MKIKTCILLFFSTVNFLSAQASLDSLLIRLDKAILNSEIYNEKKLERINDLKKEAVKTEYYSVERYIINMQLCYQYEAYICDSTISYLNRNIDIAGKLNDLNRKNESIIRLAYLMGSTGMYKEAVDLLQEINSRQLPKSLLTDYYNACDHVYGELAYYTQDERSAKNYELISQSYKDSLDKMLPADSELRRMMKENELRDDGDFAEALQLNDKKLSKEEFGTSKYALTTFHRSLTYREQGDTAQQKYYLALSALSDIQSAIKDHASLWMLAEILFEEGDIERAYSYIRFSWNETVFYNARLRSLQSAGILSLIDKTYQAMIEKKNSQLQIYIILISALMVLLAVALFYNYKQRKRLSVARQNLQTANNELKKLNKQLQSINMELSESNAIKEEYIGRFIKLCSAYIDKLDGYRRMVNKKLSAGQTAELLRMTRSQDILDEEFAELYENFDTAFLHIFPDFVSKVNELLHDDERIVLKKSELLNTELRILALIRLGIDDSSQIADFLRYSVNTIYNYRAKIKNKAKNRDNFENLIFQIR